MNDVAGAIEFLLEKGLFSPGKVLCRHFRIGKVTCLRVVHDTLGVKRFHSHWVRYALSPTERVKDCHIRSYF
jgi:hypothetical protein